MSGIVIDIQEKAYPGQGKAARHVALENLKITLKEHEFVCLVGPSGCGKTTLLNLLAGLDKSFKGHIGLIDQEKPYPLMGYVFQEPRLLPWRSVRENIELALQPGQSPDQIDFLLEVMGLKQAEHVYPERLSLGMSRRVALARAFAIEPDLLLMDEPFVSLDAPTARRIGELLVEVWQKRPHTVLFVTHNLREAITLADRLIFLSRPPTTVISDLAVDIPRARRRDEDAVEAFRRHLIHSYPQIRQLL